VAAAWGGFVARHRWSFLSAWVVAVVAMAGFAAATPRTLSPAGFETDTAASRAADLLREHFPQRTDPVVMVVLQSDRMPVTAPAYQAQLAAWKADLTRLIRGRQAVVEGPVPGRDGRTAALFVMSSRSPTDFVDLGRQAQGIHHPGPASSYVGGFGTVYNDFISDSEADLQSAERISFPIALVLLLLVFGGVVAASLPVVTGLATVTVAVALLGFVARVHTVSVFSLNATSIIGIGLGIDYSLLVVNRFREEMRSGASVEEAVATTVGTAGVATVVSGGTVAIGFGALMLSHLNVLWSMGIGGALVVAISVVSSLTLIPALLAVFGRHIDRLAAPLARARDTGPFWHWLASRVMARPFLFIVVSLAVVAVLLWPARGLRLGVEGIESLPPGAAARTAERVAEQQLGFPAHPPTLVVAQGVNDVATASQLEARLRTAAEGQPVVGPADVPPQRLPLYLSGGYAVFELQQPAADNDSRTRDWLDRLHRISWPSGITVQIGGEAAAYLDYLRVLMADFPLVFGTVLGCTLVLLGVAFRSLVLPVKAVLMNLLSVGAAMGVLTWGFQEGHFSGVLDFQAVGFVDATIPVIIFAALFGLSMDYEVFLLSRIREQWVIGHDNASAVAMGMERTGQIITSAALILVVVSSTMAFSHLAINKGLGVSFAIAILLDATLIRLLLVPAMMRVLSDLNWWPARRRL
jgi:trehalose monomycolate/heme transporter